MDAGELPPGKAEAVYGLLLSRNGLTTRRPPISWPS